MNRHYAVALAPAAKRQLKALPRGVQIHILERLDALGAEPRPFGVEKLTDAHGLYRVRVGNYRIIYQIREKQVLVLVAKVGRRDSVY